MGYGNSKGPAVVSDGGLAPVPQKLNDQFSVNVHDSFAPSIQTVHGQQPTPEAAVSSSSSISRCPAYRACRKTLSHRHGCLGLPGEAVCVRKHARRPAAAACSLILAQSFNISGDECPRWRARRSHLRRDFLVPSALPVTHAENETRRHLHPRMAARTTSNGVGRAIQFLSRKSHGGRS